MGKVLEKLKERPAVKSITENSNGIIVLLADGYASDGKVEAVVTTAHAARLFIDAASNGREPARRQRTVRSPDGNVVELPVRNVPKFTMAKIQGPPCPLYKRPKGFNPTELEGKLAFLAGFPIDSNPYGMSAAGKEWDNAYRAAQRAAGVAESVRTIPTEEREILPETDEVTPDEDFAEAA